MPELIEVEYYRRALNERIGERVQAVDVVDQNYPRPKGFPGEAFEQLVGRSLQATTRRGKLLIANFGTGNSHLALGLRFGMTGRLLFDGRGPIEVLEYSSDRNDPAWDRFALHIGAERLSVRDPRRLGSVELDPDVTALGPDAWTIDAHALQAALFRRRKAVKAALLDQQIIAGLGNLLVDECLWRCAISPGRSCEDLGAEEIEQLAASIRHTIDDLFERGGSHQGDSFESRTDGAICPRDGGPMRHDTIGGRSTWWCSEHQC